MQVDLLLMLKRDREKHWIEKRGHTRAAHRVFNLQNYYISLAIARPKILASISDYDFLSRS